MPDDHPNETVSARESSRRFTALARPSLGSAPSQTVAGDILYGADEIAVFLFGDRKYRRRVYTRIASNELPTFRIGANICARRSTLLEWIARQEAAASK
jgi:hypothetical protein